MSTSKASSTRRILSAGILALILILSLLPGLALAQEEAPAMAPPFVVTVEANGTLEIPVYGFCLEYGLPFPGEALDAGDLATDDVRQAIAYAVQQGYVDSDPWQVQLAVWYFTEGSTKVDEEHTEIADEIIAFAEGEDVPLPEEGATAMPLHQAVVEGVVTADVEGFANVSPEGFFFIGEGKLVITNLTDEAVTLLIPYGTVFSDLATEGVQDMGIYPKPGTEPPAPVETPEPTEEPTPAPTEEVTPEPTEEPTPEPTPETRTVEAPPIVPETGGFLPPEFLAALGILGASGGALAINRFRRPR